MAKGIVSKKEDKFRQGYQAYLNMMKRGGRGSFRKAKTQSEWRNLTPATKKTIMARGPK